MQSRDERGTITLWVLGLCVCVLFLGGLSLDFWRAIAVRRDLQSMADVAAVAGADGLDEQSLRAGGVALDPALVRRNVYDNLAAQSGARRVDRAHVDVDGGTVVVQLRAHVDMSLLSVFLGGGDVEIAATATAQPRRLP